MGRSRAFSQQAWRRQHYAPGQATLCAALTAFWIQERLQNRLPMQQFEAPTAEFLGALARMQALSFYPDFPHNFLPGERELSLLAKKYGTRDWDAIQREVNEEHQGDFILHDISRLFSYRSAAVVRFADPPETLACESSLPPGSAIIAVLRYLEHGQPAGHRMAYYLDQNRQHQFFDPNAGELLESDDKIFFRWLDGYLLNACYRRLEPSPEDDFLTLYKLEEVSPRVKALFRHTEADCNGKSDNEGSEEKF